MALFMTASVDGGIPVDVLFLPKHEADASLQAYLDQPMTAPLAGVPFVADVIQPGVEFKKIVPVPKGTYFVVLDNTPTAGQVAPPQNPLDDRAAVISYVVQIGRTP